MSSEQQVDQLILAKLEEHYDAAGQPDDIEAFAPKYFEELIAVLDEPADRSPSKSELSYVKQSGALVDFKLPKVKFVFSALQAVEKAEIDELHCGPSAPGLTPQEGEGEWVPLE
ncbi:hypothetical protein RSOLAG22IIIB_11302 [Rhizoctonia solani]|uniref:Uncharacterized protein n=1 Tax=Rhizoctonia solani TaxID=456999 RepID=A0A0K6G7H6_9AGAM|nr:hypothetical protein RSOLAG22IIIB_11302 [Rhizoctonia solani]